MSWLKITEMKTNKVLFDSEPTIAKDIINELKEKQMSNLSTILSPETVERVILQGDLSRLSSAEKLDYYSKVVTSLGLNGLTKPFAFIKLNGKEVLYATRDCTDQLRKIHKISIKITAREHINGVYVVTAQTSGPDGRVDESTGAVATDGLRGDNLANAYLKCETKAKRRVTLSICGLGLLDETEVESIKDAQVVSVPIEGTIGSATTATSGKPQSEFVKAVPPQPAQQPLVTFDPGEYVIQFGKEYKGKKIKDFPADKLEGFIKWCDSTAAKKNQPLSHDAAMLKVNFYKYLNGPAPVDLPEEIADIPWPEEK